MQVKQKNRDRRYRLILKYHFKINLKTSFALIVNDKERSLNLTEAIDYNSCN